MPLSPLPRNRLTCSAQVFKRLYEQVGLGWVYAFASVKPLRYVADRWGSARMLTSRASQLHAERCHFRFRVYNFWARYRLPLTRRPDMATILAEKRTCKGSS